MPLAAALGLLVLGTAAPATAAPPARGEPAGGTITVTVPSIPFLARADAFLTGPLSVRLDVLDNDTGWPSAPTLQLLDGRGRGHRTLALRGLGTLEVDRGLVRFTPLPHVRDGSTTFRYRAGSANGRATVASAHLLVHASVISTRADRVVASGTTMVDVAANDTILVAGAVPRCGVSLSVRRPALTGTSPVVLAEPARPEPPCSQPSPIRTPQGTWTAEGSVVRFTPAGHLRRPETIWYTQFTDFPYAAAAARVTVTPRSEGATGPSGGVSVPGASPSGPGVVPAGSTPQLEPSGIRSVPPVLPSPTGSRSTNSRAFEGRLTEAREHATSGTAGTPAWLRSWPLWPAAAVGGFLLWRRRFDS